MEALTTLLPTTEDFSVGRHISIVIGTFLPLIFFVFDALLLAATIHNRRDTTLPLAYIAVMCMVGMITSLSESQQLGFYVFMSPEMYQTYLVKVGREFTLVGTFSYLTAFFISLLMTINRVVVVIRPFHTDFFTQKRIFIYCGIIAILMFISMLIPYFSPCHVTFNVEKLAFVSGCAPDRHPITLFQNKYAIIVPFSCMFANLGLIVHLRFFRNNTYTKIGNFFCKTKQTTTVVFQSSGQPTTLSKMQARRDLIMMRQTVSVAIFLSLYEFGAFLMRIFPDEYAALPQSARDSYFLFRFLSIPVLNFFIYYIETGSTRRMFRRYLGISERNSDSNVNATMVTVAPKAGGGAGGARVGGRSQNTAAATPVA